MIPLSHLHVLHKIYNRLFRTSINWAIVGSLGLALQGVAVQVHDIDLATDAAGVYEIERLLAEYVVRPVALSSKGNIRSHFGALELGGIPVEIMGDVQLRDEDGHWAFPTDLCQHRLYVEVEGMQAPVLSLEHEYQVYLRLGRLEKARLIKEYLTADKKGV